MKNKLRYAGLTIGILTSLAGGYLMRKAITLDQTRIKKFPQAFLQEEKSLRDKRWDLEDKLRDEMLPNIRDIADEKFENELMDDIKKYKECRQREEEMRCEKREIIKEKNIEYPSIIEYLGGMVLPPTGLALMGLCGVGILKNYKRRENKK